MSTPNSGVVANWAESLKRFARAVHMRASDLGVDGKDHFARVVMLLRWLGHWTSAWALDSMTDQQLAEVRHRVDAIDQRVNGAWRWRGCPGEVVRMRVHDVDLSGLRGARADGLLTLREARDAGIPVSWEGITCTEGE